MIKVVAGVIVQDCRILLTQRRHDQDFPLTWECPGGKVEGKESDQDALKRELLEELGAQAPLIADSFLYCSEFQSMKQQNKMRRVLVMFYPVSINVQPLSPLEGQGIGWFDRREMVSLTLAPANRDAVNILVTHMIDQSRHG